jgi:hypothetical protein
MEQSWRRCLDRFAFREVYLVTTWTKIVIVLAALSLASCDPFGPSDPEAPSNTRVAVVAAFPQGVETELGKALSTRDMLLVDDITSDGLRLVQSVDSLSSSAFRVCLQRDLFGQASDTSHLVWTGEFSQESSTTGEEGVVIANVNYSITRSGSAARIYGSAKWTLSNANTLGWELVRWEDRAESKSGIFAFCKVGAK